MCVCVCVCVLFTQSRKDLVQPFTEGETRVLVCTDLASRGIHFDKVTHHGEREWFHFDYSMQMYQ